MEPDSTYRTNDEDTLATFNLWRELSMVVLRARHSPLPSASNEVLRQQIVSHPDTLLTPALHLWMGDNFQLEWRFREAHDVYGEIVSRFAEQRFNNASWAAIALEEIANCYHATGELDAAGDAYRQILHSHADGISIARLHYMIGRLAEEASDNQAAIAAYRQGADQPDWPRYAGTNYRDMARRAANRLESEREWFVSLPEELALRIARALATKDISALQTLASRTHFSVGIVGSERAFVDRLRTLDQLIADLQRSDITCDRRALRGCRNKLYLATEGWTGELFQGQVLFLLTCERAGYEWSGIGVPRMMPRDDDPFFPDPEIPDDPPPPPPPPIEPTTVAGLQMKAPWPSGVHMRAGGIVGFSAQLAAFAALSAPLGPFGPAVYATLMVSAAAATPCGFGPGGLYYGQPTTHVSALDSEFAVDFSRFVQGIPLLLNARGTEVLAVADGMVMAANGQFPTGDPTGSNTVLVGHAITSNALRLLLTGAAAPQFTTLYMHMDGPGLVPVSPGMFVPQGGRLGLVDDTGLSVADHLHFSLHDNTLPFMATSIMPSPLDGQTLENSDDGRCMFSTNVPFP